MNRGVRWPLLYAWLLVLSAWTLCNAATGCESPLLPNHDNQQATDREFYNAYQCITAPNIHNAAISTATILYETVSTTTISSATIANATISSGTVKSFMVLGTTTNDTAPTGRIGQYMESLSNGTNVPTSNNWGDAGSLTLTAGDWDVSFNTEVDKNTATEAQLTNIQIGISQTTGNSSTGLIDGSNMTQTRFSAGITTAGMTLASYRQSVSADTPVYGKIKATYTGGQPIIFARLSARRVR